MKHTTPFILGIVLSVAACDGVDLAESASHQPATTHTLAFFDRSASTLHSDEGDYYDEVLADIVREGLETPGDRMTLLFVHGKTLGKVNRLEAENMLVANEDGSAGSRVDRMIADRKHAEETEQFLQKALADVQRFCRDTQVARTDAAHTDLLGMLEVISESFARGNADLLHVYVLSDMFESMTGAGRRDFDRRPPADRKQAEAWAKEDAVWVQKTLNVDQEVFQEVKLRVILGPHGNKPAATPVKRYWMRLLPKVGFSRDRIIYN